MKRYKITCVIWRDTLEITDFKIHLAYPSDVSERFQEIKRDPNIIKYSGVRKFSSMKKAEEYLFKFQKKLEQKYEEEKNKND